MMKHRYRQQQSNLGTTILLCDDDEDFVQGYDEGDKTFQVYHVKGEAVDTSMLLFLLKNGWDTGHSDLWTTGYIVGWLAAFCEQEQGQFALSTLECD